MNPIEKLKSRRDLREDLQAILETDPGKRFFKRFLRDCHVTRPKFTSDPNQLLLLEGPRRIAMSYLALVAGDDPQQLINLIEQENE